VNQVAELTTSVLNVLAPTLRGLLGAADRLAVVTTDTTELARSVTAAVAGRKLAADAGLTPDQIGHAGSFPLVLELAADADVAQATTAAVMNFREQHGTDPIIVVLPGQAVLAAGADLAAARTALAAFLENREAPEHHRPPVTSGAAGRMSGKVVMVTGAAQGFGLGIATELLAQDATVVLADLNIELARQQAAELAATYGHGRAVAVRVDVSDEHSQLAAVAEVVALFGGLDVFISNAGVLRADGVMTQPVADFDLVTAVNYRGYFLGVRAVAPVLAAQHAARPQVWSDIIEINSKSGLEGSKRNFAYAGSKFGGIGLTQSFALELVEYGIKVNAICPGNYLDGPLWTDPERGLFVQYLRAGKVPGATTVAEVRSFYESKVPIGRGCLPSDLAKAVYYVVDQQYETGQAVPVTGGQNMLN